MDINSSLAAETYARARPATHPDPAPEGVLDRAASAAGDFAAALSETDRVARSTLVGEADPHALVEALAQSQLAVETAVTVRDRVVEAYQEILRMPV